jgi:hypothetical protein
MFVGAGFKSALAPQILLLENCGLRPENGHAFSCPLTFMTRQNALGRRELRRSRLFSRNKKACQ